MDIYLPLPPTPREYLIVDSGYSYIGFERDTQYFATLRLPILPRSTEDEVE